MIVSGMPNLSKSVGVSWLQCYWVVAVTLKWTSIIDVVFSVCRRRRPRFFVVVCFSPRGILLSPTLILIIQAKSTRDSTFSIWGDVSFVDDSERQYSISIEFYTFSTLIFSFEYIRLPVSKI